MKRLGYIFLAFVLSIFTLNLKGQNTEASVRLDIVLNPILNLTVNPNQQVTTLVYNTLEDYQEGVEVTNEEHLTVFSTSPYVVNVRLADEEFTKLYGETDARMILPDIQITARPVADRSGIRLETQSLTTEEKGLITDDRPALNKTFDISIRGQGGDAFDDFVDETVPSSFTNTLLYSLEVR